jgi:hypothetical protein
MLARMRRELAAPHQRPVRDNAPPASADSRRVREHPQAANRSACRHRFAVRVLKSDNLSFLIHFVVLNIITTPALTNIASNGIATSQFLDQGHLSEVKDAGN